MEVTIDRNNFLKALNHVQNVVEKRNTIPILSNILIIVEGIGLKLISTDLDIEVIEEIEAEIISGGNLTAPAHLLFDIVRKLPDGAQLLLNKNDDEEYLTLKSGKSNFKLQTLPRKDFPELTSDDHTHKFIMVGNELKRLIDRTRFAISSEETRYYLNGIYFHEAKANNEEDSISMMRAVSTDGHRLAQAELPLPEGARGMPDVIIPRKSIAEIKKLTDEVEGDIEIFLSPTKIRFNFNNIQLTSKLIDGKFPDYKRVIPFQNDKVMIVETKFFADAVDRVSTISSDRGRAIKLSIGENLLTLSVTSPDSGTAIEEIPVIYNSEPIEIGFNSKYLLDITSQLISDTTKFSFSESGAPSLIRDPADEATLYVLMPMRV